MHRRALGLLALLVVAFPISARSTGAQTNGWAPVPFAIGERLEYDVSFGRARVGRGSMEVLPMDTVRGRTTWHTLFRVTGGLPFFRVNDRYESWMDVRSLASLRHVQEIDEGPYEAKREFEIYPERGQFQQGSATPEPTVDVPLDDGSFIYFLRTIQLRVGLDTSFHNYFRVDRNPVRIRVVRRERIRVPAGEFDAFVIQPIIRTKGLFSEGGEAQIWLSDDANRIMLKMQSKLSFGSLTLTLRSHRPGTAPR